MHESGDEFLMLAEDMAHRTEICHHVDECIMPGLRKCLSPETAINVLRIAHKHHIQVELCAPISVVTSHSFSCSGEVKHL